MKFFKEPGYWIYGLVCKACGKFRCSSYLHFQEWSRLTFIRHAPE